MLMPHKEGNKQYAAACPVPSMAECVCRTSLAANLGGAHPRQYSMEHIGDASSFATAAWWIESTQQATGPLSLHLVAACASRSSVWCDDSSSSLGIALALPIADCSKQTAFSCRASLIQQEWCHHVLIGINSVLTRNCIYRSLGSWRKPEVQVEADDFVRVIPCV